MASDLIIIEKYTEFVNYIYPIIQNIERRHGVVKLRAIELIFLQPELFYKAIKTRQISKLYEADGNLASIRYYLRFLTQLNRFKGNQTKNKGISVKQHQTASILLSEVGNILNAWIIRKQKEKKN